MDDDKITVTGSSRLIARETQAEVDTLRADNARLVEALELAQATIGRLAGGARRPFSSVAGTQGVISAAIASGRAPQ